MSAEHEPKILALLCNWCSYAGADLAGISRFQYPPNIRALRVMCTGRVEPHYIFRAFLADFDAVMVLGCHPGDCHYISGNLYAEKKVMMVAKLLDIIGLGRERLILDWVSSAEGVKFARVVNEFCEKVNELGTLELGDDLSRRLRAAEHTVLSENIRTLVAKQYPFEIGENVYHEKWPPEEFERVLNAALEGTYIEALILETIQEDSLSVPDIARTTGHKPEIISFHLAGLWNRGVVTLDKVEEGYPLFISG